MSAAPNLVKLYPVKKLFVRPADDEALAYCYLRFRADGLMGQIFSEGEPTLRDFLDDYRSMRVVAAFDGQSLAGLGWLNSITDMGPGRKAECGMAFFPEIGIYRKLALANLMIDYAFDVCDLQTLYGTTPEAHRPAIAFAKRLGFELFGPIPGLKVWEGKLCGAYVSAMTRDQWRQRRA